MMMMVTGVPRAGFAAATVVGLALVAASCRSPEGRQPGPGDLPAEVTDPATPPDAAVFLPPLEDYRTDDDVDTGEIRASLDHGPVLYREIRRRLILDERGFSLGEILVVTLDPGTNGANHLLQHLFGQTDGEPADVAGVEMQRLPTVAHGILVWVGPHFAVTFARGAETTDEWLEELAEATVTAIRLDS